MLQLILKISGKVIIVHNLGSNFTTDLQYYEVWVYRLLQCNNQMEDIVEPFVPLRLGKRTADYPKMCILYRKIRPGM